MNIIVTSENKSQSDNIKYNKLSFQEQNNLLKICKKVCQCFYSSTKNTLEYKQEESINESEYFFLLKNQINLEQKKELLNKLNNSFLFTDIYLKINKIDNRLKKFILNNNNLQTMESNISKKDIIQSILKKNYHQTDERIDHIYSENYKFFLNNLAKCYKMDLFQSSNIIEKQKELMQLNLDDLYSTEEDIDNNSPKEKLECKKNLNIDPQCIFSRNYEVNETEKQKSWENLNTTLQTTNEILKNKYYLNINQKGYDVEEKNIDIQNLEEKNVEEKNIDNFEIISINNLDIFLEKKDNILYKNNTQKIILLDKTKELNIFSEKDKPYYEHLLIKKKEELLVKIIYSFYVQHLKLYIQRSSLLNEDFNHIFNILNECKYIIGFSDGEYFYLSNLIKDEISNKLSANLDSKTLMGALSFAKRGLQSEIEENSYEAIIPRIQLFNKIIEYAQKEQWKEREKEYMEIYNTYSQITKDHWGTLLIATYFNLFTPQNFIQINLKNEIVEVFKLTKSNNKDIKIEKIKFEIIGYINVYENSKDKENRIFTFKFLEEIIRSTTYKNNNLTILNKQISLKKIVEILKTVKDYEKESPQLYGKMILFTSKFLEETTTS